MAVLGEQIRQGNVLGNAEGPVLVDPSADPKKDPKATRYQKVSFDEAINKDLKVMDSTALTLCRDQKLPIIVFSIFKEGALKRVVMGQDEGTLVHCD